MDALSRRMLMSSIDQASGPVLEFCGTFQNINEFQNFSFTNVPVGAEADDRLVVVILHSERGVSRSLASCSIGGSAGTIGTGTNPSGVVPCVIVYRVVPTGTTITIAPNWSGLMSGCTIDVFTIKGLSSTTPTDVESVTGNPASTASTTTVGGVTIAGGTVAGSATCNWTGVTENSDQVNSGSPFTTSCGSNSSASSTSLTVTASMGGACRLSVASWF